MVLKGQDLEMVAGDNCDIEFEVNDPGGLDVDLTDATVDWYLKESADTEVALLHKDNSEGDGVEVTDPTHGVVVVHLVPEDTADLAPGKYFHGITVTDIDDKVYTVAMGYMTLLPKVG